MQTPILFVVIIKTNITLSVITHTMATKLSLMAVMDRPIRPTLSTLAGGHSRYSGGARPAFAPPPLLATALGLALPYLSDDCQLVTDVGRRHLRSSDVYTCIVPRTLSHIGDRCFSVAGPRLWNNLTEIRRRGTTFGHYRRLLKAFLFV